MRHRARGRGKLLNKALCLNDMPYLRRCMAKDPINEAEGLFEAYLEQNGHENPGALRHPTPDLQLRGPFDVDTLYEVMGKGPYRVSRATLYNTLDLLLDCNLGDSTSLATKGRNTRNATVSSNTTMSSSDSGEVRICDPRIQQIKATLEELFDIEVLHHSLNIYARKRLTSPGQIA